MILDIYASFHTWFFSHFRSNWKRHWNWIGTTRHCWNIARQLIATVSDKKYFDCWTTKQIVWILRYLSFHIKIPLFDFSWEIAEDDSRTDLHVVSSNYIFKGIFCLHKAVLGPPIVRLGDLQKYVFFFARKLLFSLGMFKRNSRCLREKPMGWLIAMHIQSPSCFGFLLAGRKVISANLSKLRNVSTETVKCTIVCTIAPCNKFPVGIAQKLKHTDR